LSDAPRLVEAARRGLEHGQTDEVRRAAHTLKSNGATFGATSLSELSRQLEALAKSGIPEGADELIARIDAEYERVRIALERVRKGRPWPRVRAVVDEPSHREFPWLEVVATTGQPLTIHCSAKIYAPELCSEPLLGDYPATVPTAHVLDQEEWVFLQVALKDSFAFGSLRV
jgi:hypothetical protein